MPGTKRYNFKKILGTTVWILLGMGTIVLLGAAVHQKNNNKCKAVEIKIKGVKNNFFIDKADVNTMLEKMNLGKLVFRPLNTFNLAGMETYLKKNEWIKSAELYFDNNDVLRINIMEREPIARIFTVAGTSYYIDSSLKRLPLSSKFSARLPVFTNFPAMGNTPSKADTNLLTDVKNIGSYVLEDPFWMAQIEQIDITPARSFEMIPKIGNQVIIFGSADNWQEKFNNLLTFYKNVQSKVGWNKYASINVSYKDQVVAVKRGAGDIKLDSLRSKELIKLLIANALKPVYDSVYSIQLVQPKEDNIIPLSKSRDENLTEDLFEDPSPAGQGKSSDTLIPNLNPTPNEKSDPVPAKKTVIKPINKKPSVQQLKKPKAIMKAKNDY